MPKISVIIPTLNRCAYLRKCLDAIVRQDFTDYEVIVVDGGSTDGTLSLISGYKVELVRQDRRGFCNALNLGVKKASGAIIAFTDDDGIPNQHWLSSINHTYEVSSDDVKGVGGLYINQNEKLGDYATIKWLKSSKFLKIFAKLFLLIIYGNDTEQVGHVYSSGATIGHDFDLTDGKSIETDYLGGCNMSFKREVFEEIGLFDENLVGQGQYNEVDLCLRTKKYGYKILFNPKIRVQHQKETRINQQKRNWNFLSDDQIKNFLYFYFKNLKSEKVSDFLKFSFYFTYLSVCVEAERLHLKS